jgi:HNH endonuclease
MDAALRALVRDRAGNRCEYCRMHQEWFPARRLHVEHIVARQHGGTDDSSNLALACFHCNQFKGTNLSGIDPVTSEVTPLFNPRRDAWDREFLMDGPRIVGLTPIGRVTVRVLAMNAPQRLELRRMLLKFGQVR